MNIYFTVPSGFPLLMSIFLVPCGRIFACVKVKSRIIGGDMKKEKRREKEKLTEMVIKEFY